MIGVPVPFSQHFLYLFGLLRPPLTEFHLNHHALVAQNLGPGTAQSPSCEEPPKFVHRLSTEMTGVLLLARHKAAVAYAKVRVITGPRFLAVAYVSASFGHGQSLVHILRYVHPPSQKVSASFTQLIPSLKDIPYSS